MASSDAEQWRRAVEEEELALIKNHTWTKPTLPAGRKAITAKIIFKKKRGADGKINRYKARLVVRGFSQRPGIDYNETYAPVIRSSLFVSYFRWLLKKTSKSRSLILRLHSLMVNLTKKFLCSYLQV